MVDIAATLIHWYAENKRELPWRETTDPYRIWISEIILQQTRVVQGLEYFNRFMLRFPDVRALAEAPGDEVMKYWQGLGYYSRARNLHAAAKEIVEKFGGEFHQIVDDVKLNHKTPLIIEIPDRHGTGRKPDFITGYVNEAIGLKL